MDYIILASGLALILAGAHYLTLGASAIAKRFNISEFVIGLTIVAIGTSAPELVVSVMASLSGSGGIAIGNVVGSNIFNVFMILGITSLIMPLELSSNSIRRDIPFGVLAAVILMTALSDEVLGDGSAIGISRSEGVMMLGFFAIFMAYTLLSSGSKATTKSPAENSLAPVKEQKIWISIFITLGGLAGLIYGGNLFLDSSVRIAISWGLSQSVIAITLMAGGTSVPELATCIVAATKGKPQMALGNVIGSNITNIFLVLGASATISPLTMGGITLTDILVVLASSVALFITAFTFKSKQLDRIEGALFIVIYLGYIFYLLK